MARTDFAPLSLLSALDEQVAAHGMAADPAALGVLAHAARDLGVTDVLVSVMVDEDEPEAARVRAYSKVSSAVSGQVSGPVVLRELQPAC
jgi:hypothetical protein